MTNAGLASSRMRARRIFSGCSCEVASFVFYLPHCAVDGDGKGGVGGGDGLSGTDGVWEPPPSRKSSKQA